MKKAYFIIIFSFLLFSGCSPEVETTVEIPDPAVKILDLSQKPSYQINEVGQIKADQEVELIAKANGTIDKSRMNVGDAVDKDQLIAQIAFDESNNPARVNYDNVRTQLSNAQQNFNQISANNQDSITRSRLRSESLETTLGRLQRNLNELYVSNESTKKTLELQLANTKKNAETAQINFDNLVKQFDQSWLDLLNSSKTSLDGLFVKINANFSSIEDIINPDNRFHFSASDLTKGLGEANSVQRNEVINSYIAFRSSFPTNQQKYEDYLPLSQNTVTPAIAEVRKAMNSLIKFIGEVRKMLDNSISTSQLSAATLAGYVTSVNTIESLLVGDLATLDALDQALASFKLDKVSQLATAENNKIIASNQLAEAENALLQFGASSRASVQDLEAQIAATQNDILSAQADLASAQRSSGLSNSSSTLQISTLQNQLRLAENSLEDNKVLSPIAGVLGEFVVDEGDYVSAGMYLGKVIKSDVVKVIFYLSKENVDRIHLGKAFTFHLATQKDTTFTGFVTKIAPAADPISKKILVEGSVDNAQFQLNPEMYVNLTLDLSQKAFDPNKIYVPMNAIIFAQNEQYVYVLEGETAVRRPIQIGEVLDAWVEVVSGLTTEDQLIVEGQRNLPPAGGVTVRIIQ